MPTAEHTHAVLEGLISVLAALEAGSREVYAVHLAPDLRGREVARLEALAQAAGAAVVRTDAGAVDALARGRTHGGVVALAGPRRFVPLGALVRAPSRPFVAMLDGAEDPYSYGHSVRALYAAGADGLVVRPREWRGAENVIARSSAGASELLPTALAESPLEAAEGLRSGGLAVVCATGERDAVPLDRADLTVPLFLVFGGERRGVSRRLLAEADALVRIPYGREFPRSLGLAAAAGALGFELLRQRRASTPWKFPERRPAYGVARIPGGMERNRYSATLSQLGTGAVSDRAADYRGARRWPGMRATLLGGA